jgi:hypothetical protein
MVRSSKRADSISSHQTVTRGRSTKALPGLLAQLDNASGDAHPPAAPIARGSAASRPPGIRTKADFLPTRRCATRLERAALRALAAEKAALRGQRLLQLRCDLGRICRNIRRDAPGSYRQQHKHDRKGQGADTCRKVTFRRCVHRVLTLQSSPGPAFTGVTESRGKFVAGERRFSGLFPLPPRRLEWRRNF